MIFLLLMFSLFPLFFANYFLGGVERRRRGPDRDSNWGIPVAEKQGLAPGLWPDFSSFVSLRCAVTGETFSS